MKYVYITLISYLFFASGCSKDTRLNYYTIAKEALFVDSVNKIISDYEDNNLSAKLILFRIHASDVNNTSESFKIGFPFKIIKSKLDDNSAFSNINAIKIDLCSNGTKTTSIKDMIPVLKKGSMRTLFISLEKMQENGLVPVLAENQKDICLYLSTELMSSWDYKVKEESNSIRYTADEINTIRAEYESLTQ